MIKPGFDMDIRFQKRTLLAAAALIFSFLIILVVAGIVSPNLPAVRVLLLVSGAYLAYESTQKIKLTRSHLDSYKHALDVSCIVSITKIDGTIDYVSDKFVEVSKYSRAELIGRTHQLLNSGCHSEAFFKDLHETIKSGRVWRNDIRNKTKTGEYFWVDTHIVPLRSANGDVCEYLTIFQDITARKQVESDLKAQRENAETELKTKSLFLANMSHEIRTPMNAILGFASLIQDQQTSDRDREEFVSRIKSNGDLLVRVIDDILNIAKYEDGNVPVESINFSPRELINEIVRDFESLARQKGIHLGVVYENLIPRVMCSDPLRLRQILTNVIGNAIKFTEKGFVRLNLRYVAPELGARRDYLEIEILDSGVGIDDRAKSLIFSPFTQADSSVTRRFGGTGLGLTLAKRIAIALDGDLTLKTSTPNQGSVFLLKVPTKTLSVELVNGNNSPERTSSSPLGGIDYPRLKGKRVLLVEDSKDSAALATIYLTREGAQVEHANNGLEAIARVEHNTYDIVVMDVQMPIMDGLEATKILRRKGFSRPIIALTAHALKEEVEGSHLAGCTAHLTKPIQRERLVAAMVAALNLSDAQDIGVS